MCLRYTTLVMSDVVKQLKIPKIIMIRKETSYFCSVQVLWNSRILQHETRVATVAFYTRYHMRKSVTKAIKNRWSFHVVVRSFYFFRNNNKAGYFQELLSCSLVSITNRDKFLKFQFIVSRSQTPVLFSTGLITLHQHFTPLMFALCSTSKQLIIPVDCVP